MCVLCVLGLGVGGKWDSLACLLDNCVLKHFVHLYLFFLHCIVSKKKIIKNKK